MEPFDPDAPVTTTSEERQWALGCHLIAFAGLLVPLGSVLGPLVLWLIKREESAFIDHHGRESLNFQISMLIYIFVASLLVFAVIGLVLLPVVLIAWLVLTIVAAIRTSESKLYRYPLSLRMF